MPNSTWTPDNVAAFLSALTGSIAMWWIYFHKGAEAGSEKLSKSAESGRLARLAYTYLHMPIVGGIILAAVADELVLKHPHGHSDLQDRAERGRRPAGVSGRDHPVQARDPRLPAAVPRRRHHRAARHGRGFGRDLSPLWLSILTTAIMIVVAVWESLSLRGKPQE